MFSFFWWCGCWDMWNYIWSVFFSISRILLRLYTRWRYMASWARSGSCPAIASAISRCVSTVSSCRAPLVVSTNRGIELLMTGIRRGTTTFLLLNAMAVWNSMSFWVWSSCLFNNASVSSQSAVIFLCHFHRHGQQPLQQWKVQAENALPADHESASVYRW